MVEIRPADWSEKYFSGQSTRSSSRVILSPSCTKWFYSSIFPGAFHSTKISGLWFENFLVSNGTGQVRTVSFHSTRKTSFALIEMEDVESLVLVLELHDDFDGDISDIV